MLYNHHSPSLKVASRCGAKARAIKNQEKRKKGALKELGKGKKD
jgi:hypothetical protein